MATCEAGSARESFRLLRSVDHQDANRFRTANRHVPESANARAATSGPTPRNSIRCDPRDSTTLDSLAAIDSARVACRGDHGALVRWLSCDHHTQVRDRTDGIGACLWLHLGEATRPR